jgi:hypothetical protein
LQASRASDTETLQSQVTKAAKKRLSLSGLEVLHGRLFLFLRFELRDECSEMRFGMAARNNADGKAASTTQANSLRFVIIWPVLTPATGR